MTLSLLLFSAFAVALLILLVVALAGGRLASAPVESDAESDSSRRHVAYYSQVRQALAPEDYAFLASRAPRGLLRRVRAERRAVALAYIAGLREDFLKLWRLGRVVSRLTPNFKAAQELAALRVGLSFALRYEAIRLALLLGFAPLPNLGSLNEVVSKLAMRLELTMQDLGERAAAASNLTSSLNRRGLDTP